MAPHRAILPQFSICCSMKSSRLSPTLSKQYLNFIVLNASARFSLFLQSRTWLTYFSTTPNLWGEVSPMTLIPFLLRSWHRRMPVAPDTVDTTTVSPGLGDMIQNPAYAASPLLMRYKNSPSPYISTNFLSTTKHYLCLAQSKMLQLQVPIFPKTYAPTSQSSLPWITFPKPKQLNISPTFTFRKYVWAPARKNFITGSIEKQTVFITISAGVQIRGRDSIIK